MMSRRDWKMSRRGQKKTSGRGSKELACKCSLRFRAHDYHTCNFVSVLVYRAAFKWRNIQIAIKAVT